MTEKVSSAMESCRDMIATNLYSAAGDNSKAITGLLSLCNESATTTYGGKAENDIVAADGTKPWEGKLDSTSEVITLAIIRTLRSGAKIKGGMTGKPDLIVTTETIYNKILNLLSVQQQFKEAEGLTKAGFTGLTFDGMTVAVDDYCPDGHLFALNTKHLGFAVHANGYFVRTPWEKLTSGAQGRSMKILCDLNLVSNNRKAHKGHSNLAVA